MSGVRYFYTDPLAAAWMAKHFGMRFRSAEDDKHFYEWGDYLHWNWDSKSGPTESDDCLYIHLDSLDLLEPKEGDYCLLEDGSVGECQWSRSDAVMMGIRGFSGAYEQDALPIDLISRIIQRNGKAFHWPEREAA